MQLQSALLEVLVDPGDHQPLWYVADEAVLYNPRGRRKYAVAPEGIPVLLADDAVVVDDDEHARLCARSAAAELITTGGAQ